MNIYEYGPPGLSTSLESIHYNGWLLLLKTVKHFDLHTSWLPGPPYLKQVNIHKYHSSPIYSVGLSFARGCTPQYREWTARPH